MNRRKQVCTSRATAVRVCLVGCNVMSCWLLCFGGARKRAWLKLLQSERHETKCPLTSDKLAAIENGLVIGASSGAMHQVANIANPAKSWGHKQEPRALIECFRASKKAHIYRLASISSMAIIIDVV